MRYRLDTNNDVHTVETKKIGCTGFHAGETHAGHGKIICANPKLVIETDLAKEAMAMESLRIKL
jgi:ATP sulfurylase